MNHAAAVRPALEGIHFTDAGTGSPAIVFVHGWSCSHTDWDAQVAALSSHHRCIAIDLPGHGASARPREITIAAMAEAVNALVDHLGLDEVVLVGHSMGCRVSTQAWSAARARIRGIVHVDGSLLEGDPEAMVGRFKTQIAEQGADALLDRLYADFCVPATPEALRQSIARRRGGLDAGFFSELFLDFVRWDATHSRERLGRLDIPVMLIQSSSLDASGRRVPLAQGETTPWTRAVAQRLPGARIVIVSGVGHFTMLEAPERVTALIESFVHSLAECSHPGH